VFEGENCEVDNWSKNEILYPLLNYMQADLYPRQGGIEDYCMIYAMIDQRCPNELVKWIQRMRTTSR
jgi:hypothetical protein